MVVWHFRRATLSILWPAVLARTLQCALKDRKQATATSLETPQPNEAFALADGAVLMEDLMRASMEVDANIKNIRSSSIGGSNLHYLPLSDTLTRHHDTILDMISLTSDAFQAKYRGSNVNQQVGAFSQTIRDRILDFGNLTKIKDKDSLLKRYTESLGYNVLNIGEGLQADIDQTAKDIKVDVKLGERLRNNPALNDLADLLDSYPNELTLFNKKKMLVRFTDLLPQANSDARILAALDGAGPTVQRLIQLVGERVDDDELRALLEQLKPKISPMQDHEISRVLSDLSEWNPYKIVFVDDLVKVHPAHGTIYVQKLAASSVTQSLLVKVDGEVVAVKVRRPHFSTILTDEKTMFSKIMDRKYASLGVDVRNALQKVEAEMSFAQEARNIELVAPGYSKESAQIRAISGRHPTSIGGKSADNILIMPLAEGQPIDSFKGGKEVEIRGKAAVDYYDSWLGRALFGDGYFHAAPHPSNTFLSISPEGSYSVTPIDYGSVGQLNDYEKQAAFLFKTGLASGDAALIVQSVEANASHLTIAQKQKLQAAVQARLDNSDPMSRGVAVLEVVKNNDVHVNEQLALFVRADGMFSSHFKDGISYKSDKFQAKYNSQMRNLVVELADKKILTSRNIPELKKYRAVNNLKKGLKVAGVVGVLTIPLILAATPLVLELSDGTNKEPAEEELTTPEVRFVELTKDLEPGGM